MTRLPQFRLRTLFLLVACGAFGLAAEGMMYPVYAAMIVGLVQQIGEIRASRRDGAVCEAGLSFAINFAICWRFVLVVLLAVCIGLQLLFVRRILQAATREDVFFPMPDYDIVAQVCAIVVFSNSIARWQGLRLVAPHRRWPTIAHGLLESLSPRLYCPMWQWSPS